MSEALHARCPGCRTTFVVTAVQLEVRGGLVRCGHCATVFQAERHAMDAPATKQRKRQRRSERRATAGRRSDSQAAGKRQRRGRRKDTAQTPAAVEPLAPATAEVTPAEFVTPALAKILLAGQSRPVRQGLWTLATLVLVALLAAQVVYFYASELARFPRLKPWVVTVCAHLACVIRSPQDISRIQLLRSSIAPHPKQRDALRIRSSLVNRADFAQPFPLMEVTLTSRNGEVVARRTYLPHEYLAPAYWQARMTPHVVIDGILDINHPTPVPAGYEIRLIAAP
ncbi:MAG: zinc-ribbon and DUF3426 domain-containing protein [Acidiferrobacterales bacterium]|nr:zinc-ribbon and DUF3426 domain-containing protein [Acidiferrobacterales bacterium]